MSAPKHVVGLSGGKARILKIEPTIAYMETLPDDSTLYVGLRADEEARRGLYGEDMLVRFPLREHTPEKVAATIAGLKEQAERYDRTSGVPGTLSDQQETP